MNQKRSNQMLQTALAIAVSFVFSNPALASDDKQAITAPSLDICSAYLVEGDVAVKIYTIGGPLSRTLKRTAQRPTPVPYTLQSLGFELGEQPLKSHGGKIVSEFYYDSSTKSQVTLSLNDLQTYSGTLPRILVVEKNKDLDWYFMNSGKYRVESYSPVGMPSTTSEAFDQILIPEVWQTLNTQERAELMKSAFRVLRPGGTLRLTLRVQDVDQLAPELNGLLEDSAARGLFDSMKKQVDAALNGSSYKMLARIQKVSFEPTAEQLTSEAFNDSLGPTVVSESRFNALEGVKNPSIQVLFVIRKPGDGWGEWSLGY